MTARIPAYVVVSGPPGSGKTTLAPRLAAELDLPLIAKDTIKQALLAVLDVPVNTVRTHLHRGRGRLARWLRAARWASSSRPAFR